MKRKNFRNLLISLGGIISVAAPLAAVVACDTSIHYTAHPGVIVSVSHNAASVRFDYNQKPFEDWSKLTDKEKADFEDKKIFEDHNNAGFYMNKPKTPADLADAITKGMKAVFGDAKLSSFQPLIISGGSSANSFTLTGNNLLEGWTIALDGLSTKDNFAKLIDAADKTKVLFDDIKSHLARIDADQSVPTASKDAEKKTAFAGFISANASSALIKLDKIGVTNTKSFQTATTDEAKKEFTDSWAALNKASTAVDNLDAIMKANVQA